jgi:hypothetical protein
MIDALVDGIVAIATQAALTAVREAVRETENTRVGVEFVDAGVLRSHDHEIVGFGNAGRRLLGVLAGALMDRILPLKPPDTEATK